ncbi:MAG: SDR family NAD(P)-dependent oxidoreductase, partial [Deinococcales bacterium]
MDLSDNTVLITGGATGIGLHMAEAFVREGSRVLICGRREEKLARARQVLPDVEALRCDVADAGDRERLAVWAVPSGVNVLVNYAGMQRMVDFTHGPGALEAGDNEVRCNLEGPVYLTARLVPHLRSVKSPAVVNVSSGHGFVPMAMMPVYCATKAALHSFTVSLRRQLSGVGVRVFELIPP